jgi:peptidoglycan/LPS O-acetylase OafA/YrhL
MRERANRLDVRIPLATAAPLTSSSGPQRRAPSQPSGQRRLAGIDGLRAVAALWVVLFHINAFSGAWFPSLPVLNLALRSGSTGVSLFLVLSGFCLYLPFAGGRTARFKAGEFLLRRCRRLMPAYYTSVIGAVALIMLFGRQLGFGAMTWSAMAWQVLTHATLTHTLFPSTFYALNGAYWSLGLEWQLYLSLPLLVWGVRRFGIRNTVIAVVACNVAYRLVLAEAIAHGYIQRGTPLAGVVLPNLLPGRWAEFAFGMVAAELYVTGYLTRWARFAGLMIVALIPLVLLGLTAASFDWPLSHIFFGGVFVLLLSVVLAGNNVVARVFAWRPLVAIGVMSYSLYLVHQPVIQGMAYVLYNDLHVPPVASFWLLILLLPVILLLAWVLFIAVERRTITSSSSASPVFGGAGGWATAVAPVLRGWRDRSARGLASVARWPAWLGRGTD